MSRDERRPRITVGEMIALLGKFDPSLPIVVDAYEMGLSSPRPPRLYSITLDVADEYGGGMFGDFEDAGHGSPDAFDAVYLER